MNTKKIQWILLLLAGAIVALSLAVKHVQSRDTVTIIILLIILVLVIFKSSRDIIMQLLKALLNLLVSLSNQAEKQSQNKTHEHRQESFKSSPKNFTSSFKPTKMNSPIPPSPKPSSAPSLYYFQCRYCYLLIKSKSTPISTKCTVPSRMHAWLRIAEYAGEGNNPYQCKYCSETIYAKKILANTQCSEPNRMHAWQRWNN